MVRKPPAGEEKERCRDEGAALVDGGKSQDLVDHV
jgi:hypothetical protein